MDVVIALVAFATGLALVLVGLWWLAGRVRRRGGGGSLMGPFEELWYPTAQVARVETREQEQRAVPAPSPGEPQ